MGRGATAACACTCGETDTFGLMAPNGSPNDDDKEGGGTDGYVSSRARGSVPFIPNDSDDAGVVMFVTLLVEISGGENGYCEERDAEADEDDGGVVDGGVSRAAVYDGRWICEGGRGMSTRADGTPGTPLRIA